MTADRDVPRALLRGVNSVPFRRARPIADVLGRPVRDEELTGAIDALLADAALRERMVGIAARMQQARGTERAADLNERVATTHALVLHA